MFLLPLILLLLESYFCFHQVHEIWLSLLVLGHIIETFFLLLQCVILHYVPQILLLHSGISEIKVPSSIASTSF